MARLLHTYTRPKFPPGLSTSTYLPVPTYRYLRTGRARAPQLGVCSLGLVALRAASHSWRITIILKKMGPQAAAAAYSCTLNLVLDSTKRQPSYQLGYGADQLACSAIITYIDISIRAVCLNLGNNALYAKVPRFSTGPSVPDRI